MAATLPLAEIDRLPADKQELLRLCARWARRIYREGGSNPRWVFEFDEGGGSYSTIKLPQGSLRPLPILNMLAGQGPGFDERLRRLEPHILDVLR